MCRSGRGSRRIDDRFDRELSSKRCRSYVGRNNGYIRNHNRNGNTLYVVDIGVRPSYRKLGLGKWLIYRMAQSVFIKNYQGASK